MSDEHINPISTLDAAMALCNDSGGPAFPLKRENSDGSVVHCRGMSLRDYFAAAALAAFSDRMHEAANVVSTQDKPKPVWMAEACYAVADAMLEARK